MWGVPVAGGGPSSGWWGAPWHNREAGWLPCQWCGLPVPVESPRGATPEVGSRRGRGWRGQGARHEHEGGTGSVVVSLSQGAWKREGGCCLPFCFFPCPPAGRPSGGVAREGGQGQGGGRRRREHEAVASRWWGKREPDQATALGCRGGLVFPWRCAWWPGSDGRAWALVGVPTDAGELAAQGGGG